MEPVLKPSERIKKLAALSEAVEIDPNVPPRRYYRSGLEMVRMANVYLEEGSLQNAYVLYLKFMTLFIEKIRKHPDFATVPETIRATNSEKLREVLPKAEKLKAKLIDQFTKEYNQYLEEEKLRQERERQLRLKREQEEREKQLKLKRGISANVTDNISIPVLPAIPIDDISYPDPLIDKSRDSSRPDLPSELNIPSVPISIKPNIPTAPKPSLSPTAPKLEDVQPIPNKLDVPELPTAPNFDRGTKPSSLLSPSVTSKAFLLRTVIVPSRLLSSFINIAHRNTSNNVETCGILAGKLERNQLFITHMIIPKQKGTSDSCVTENEEEIFDFQDQHNLITLGWIHTHPTQTAFLSSVDLHTHCSYQTMMPEAIAIVCAPKYEQTGFFTLTPHYGLEYISKCRKTGFHPHPSEKPLFQECEHTKIDHSAVIELVDLRSD